MIEDDSEARWATAGDGVFMGEPIGDLAAHIDPEVISALARWRGIDGHVLSQFGAILTTHAGAFVGDSTGYLNALHGFVAEKITYDSIAPGHTIDFPEATTVPGWDIKVDGEAFQIKEGSHAAALVHEALERYPQYRHFFTDPQTAANLRAEGIDAHGVPGLEPQHIASETAATITGIDALAHAGIPQLPILSTLTTIFRRLENVHEGRLSYSTAAREGAIDIGSRGVGLALGIKAASVGLVALGAFPFAIVVLPAAGIAGALGMQHFVNRRRADGLDDLLENFYAVRSAAEHSAEILVDVARTRLAKAISSTRAEDEDALFRLRLEWTERVTEAETATYRELVMCADDVLANLHLHDRHASARRFADAAANPDRFARLAAIDTAIETELLHSPEFGKSRHQRDLALVRTSYQDRCIFLRHLQTRIDREIAQRRRASQGNIADAAVEAYMQIILQTARLCQRVVDAFLDVDRRLATLNRDQPPKRATDA